MTEYFDSHCHLTAEQFDADRAAVIERAQQAGVTRILTLGSDLETSRAAAALAESNPGVYAAVGIHPEAAASSDFAAVEMLRELAAHPKVVAIGEIGLDYYWDRTTADIQQRLFERQLELASELRLPVVIHDRDAHAQVLATLRAGAALALRGVLHAFSGDIAMARAAIDLGYFISLGGPITFLNNKRAPELVRALPLAQLLVETDAPYLAPHPHRGKRNEPAYLPLVAQRIAELQGVSVEQVAEQTSRIARQLFSV